MRSPQAQPVEALGGAAPDRGLVGLREAGEQRVGLAHDVGVLAGEAGDRPVAAEHQAIGAEAGERVVDVALQRGGVPARRVGGGVEAGDLRVHARHGGRLGQQRRPRLPAAGRDRRLGEVVDDHPQARYSRRDLGYELQMLGQDRDDVERDAVLGEHAERLDHLRPHQPARVGLVVDQVAHADEQRLLRPRRGARGGRLRVEQRQPADDAGDPLVLARVGEHRGRVLVVVLGLHQHGRVDASRDQLRQQLAGVVAAVGRRRQRGQRRIATALDLPDVLVRVDSHHRSLLHASGGVGRRSDDRRAAA